MNEDKQEPPVEEPEVEAIPEPEGDTEIIETDFDIGQDNFSGAVSMDLDIHKIVFSISAVGIMLFTFLTLAFQNDAEPLFVGLRDWLTGNLDWFFLLSGNIFVLVCFGLILSPLGKVRLGGPDAASFRDLMKQMLAVIQRRRLIINIPFVLASIMGAGFDLMSSMTGGLVANRILTRDQVKSLRQDNVVSEGAKTFADLGIKPVTMDSMLPEYLWPYRPSGQYAAIKDSAKNLRKV